MKSILLGLYTGEIIPWERPNPQSGEQLEIVRKIEEEERYLMEKMSPEDSKRLQRLSDLYMELSSSAEASAFSYGFSLGLFLSMDAMKEAENLFNAPTINV